MSKHRPMSHHPEYYRWLTELERGSNGWHPDLTSLSTRLASLDHDLERVKELAGRLGDKQASVLLDRSAVTEGWARDGLRGSGAPSALSAINSPAR